MSIGDRSVQRLGFGTMRLCGSGAFGEPVDRGEAVEVLRRAVELGVEFIDTADSYGPEISEELIHDALHPYGENLVIATKVGLVHSSADTWEINGNPQRLIEAAEASLRRLGVEALDLLQLHRIDAAVPLADQLGALVELQNAGKVRAIGISNVELDQFEAAVTVAPIVSVQNRYSLTDRRYEDVMRRCEESGLAFIAYAPLDDGELTKPGGRPIDRPLDNLGWRIQALPSQLALSWLLRHSPAILPIPGTSSVDHLEENLETLGVNLDINDYDMLSRLVAPGSAA